MTPPALPPPGPERLTTKIFIKPVQRIREAERIERTYFVPEPRERHTDPIPVVVQPNITINVEPRTDVQRPDTAKKEPDRQPETPNVAAEIASFIRDRDTLADKSVPEAEQKVFGNPNKKSSEEGIKTIPETIRNPNKNNSGVELFEGDKSAPQADSRQSDPNKKVFKKRGKIGRQRKYEVLGNGGEEPVKTVILFRHIRGHHWPGMSDDMQAYYNKFYFSKPKKGASDYAKHLKCYERSNRWINEYETASTLADSGT